jgi:hypothetical protein
MGRSFSSGLLLEKNGKRSPAFPSGAASLTDNPSLAGARIDALSRPRPDIIAAARRRTATPARAQQAGAAINEAFCAVPPADAAPG